MRLSAARSLAGCFSPQSQLSSLSQSFLPWSAVRKNLKTWLTRIREDFMNEQLETSAAIDQEPSGTVPQKPAPSSNGKRLLWFLVIPALLACSAFVTAYARRASNTSLAATTKTLAMQNVNVIHAELGSPTTELTVPGTAQAFSESPIYARINGYVRAWNADIGA